ncbi:p21-activated protein kinase-interacting protein 1, partial [Sorex araneus]|uniref:p21-activated protein kinase-interacting protein 1 n=1 Tax=Sorex araneus TaxID=42254 RepID=UPI002433A436
MELLAGCYEQVLFGFSVRPGGRAWAPAAGFTHHAHSACLTAVAAGGRFAVTGSKDETIHIYDLRRRLDHGALVHHRGSITCLRFHGSRHLLSGAEDGLICVWDARKWECLKTLRAHRGHVTCLSIHPSGKLALSVGTDKTLRTWNLVEGRSAFVKNIKQNAHIVEWSPGGEKYVVAVQNRIDVYRLATASVSGTITCGKRVSALAFLSESVLAVACDEEIVRVFDCDSQLCLCEWRAHENRVKDVCSLEVQGQRVLVTASSDGFIKAWQFSEDMKVPPALLCAAKTSARLTCVAVWLDGAVGSGAGQPPGAEPSPVSREQPEVCEEDEEEEEE